MSQGREGLYILPPMLLLTLDLTLCTLTEGRGHVMHFKVTPTPQAYHTWKRFDRNLKREKTSILLSTGEVKKSKKKECIQ